MNFSPRLYQIGIVIGILLAASPLFGMAGTVYGMMRSFQVLGSNSYSDQQALAKNIGVVLRSTALGLALCPLGITILVLSLVMRSRARRLTPPPLPTCSLP